jgi:hypothetical protein
LLQSRSPLALARLAALASECWQFSSCPPTNKTSCFARSATWFWARNLLIRAITPSEGQRLVSVTRSLGSTRYLLGESHERKVFAFKLTNECWKTFSENYEESWHFPLASFVYKKVKRNNKRAGPTEYSCHLTSVWIFPQQVCDIWCHNRVPDWVTHVW